MWRIWHRLFGWQYVHMVTYPMGCVHAIRRVRWTAAGERYVKWHDELVFIDRPHTGWNFTPLTWIEKPSTNNSTETT